MIVSACFPVQMTSLSTIPIYYREPHKIERSMFLFWYMIFIDVIVCIEWHYIMALSRSFRIPYIGHTIQWSFWIYFLAAMKWNCVSVCVCLHLLNNSINSDHFESAFAVQFCCVFKAYWPHLCLLCLQQNDLIALHPHHILSSHWSIHVKWCLLHNKLNYCEVPFCFTEITNYCHRLFLSPEGKFCVQKLFVHGKCSAYRNFICLCISLLLLSVVFFPIEKDLEMKFNSNN